MSIPVMPQHLEFWRNSVEHGLILHMGLDRVHHLRQEHHGLR
jgi:hypothetical protein